MAEVNRIRKLPDGTVQRVGFGSLKDERQAQRESRQHRVILADPQGSEQQQHNYQSPHPDALASGLVERQGHRHGQAVRQHAEQEEGQTRNELLRQLVVEQRRTNRLILLILALGVGAVAAAAAFLVAID